MTQKEIAKKLNVTQTAVSLALRGSTRISVELREAVQQIAQSTGYQANLSGQMLRKKKCNIIGAFFPRLTNLFYAELFQEVHKKLTANGYMLYLASGETPDEQRKNVQILQQMRVSGVIGMASAWEILKPLKDEGIAMVLYGGDKRLDAGISQVLPARYQGTEDLVKHLLSGGRKRIAFLAPASCCNESRYMAYKDVLQSAGLSPMPVFFEEEAGLNYMESGFCAMAEFLKTNRIDAVFVYNDELAIACKRAVVSAGFSVPGDIAVAGFDNISTGAYLSPPLTTVEQPLQLIVDTLIEELFAALDDKDHCNFVSIPCKLIVREST